MKDRRLIKKRRQTLVLIVSILLIVILAAAGVYALKRGNRLDTRYEEPQSESIATTPEPQSTAMVFMPTNAPA